MMLPSGGCACWKLAPVSAQATGLQCTGRCFPGPVMVKVPFRRLAAPGDVLVPHQARVWGGKRYKVFSAASPGAVAAAACEGYTEFRQGTQWRPIRTFKYRPWGGYRHGERKGGPKRESRKPRLSARSRALSSPTASIALDLGFVAVPHPWRRHPPAAEG